jgi:hypothetical protein
MEQEEINILERLKTQFTTGIVTKKTVVQAREIWNKYNTPPVTYCMCTSVKRNIYAKQFIEWYESLN